LCLPPAIPCSGLGTHPSTLLRAVSLSNGKGCPYRLFGDYPLGTGSLSFRKVSVKHLPRYLAEFTYRFSGREQEDLFVQTLLRSVGTIGMAYRELVVSRWTPKLKTRRL